MNQNKLGTYQHKSIRFWTNPLIVGGVSASVVSTFFILLSLLASNIAYERFKNLSTDIFFLPIAQINLSFGGISNENVGIQNYIDWYAIPYSLILSTIFTIALERYNKLKESLQTEIVSILSLYRLMKDVKIRGKAIGNLISYITHIKNYGFKEVSDENLGTVGEKLLEGSRLAIVKASHKNKKQLINQVNDIITNRNARLACLGRALPSVLWLTLTASSAIWVIFFLFTSITNLYLYLIFTWSITFIISSIVTTIIRLDEPLQEDSNINQRFWNIE